MWMIKSHAKIQDENFRLKHMGCQHNKLKFSKTIFKVKIIQILQI